jgi:hypothetical protein
MVRGEVGRIDEARADIEAANAVVPEQSATTAEHHLDVARAYIQRGEVLDLEERNVRSAELVRLRERTRDAARVELDSGFDTSVVRQAWRRLKVLATARR